LEKTNNNANIKLIVLVYLIRKGWGVSVLPPYFHPMKERFSGVQGNAFQVAKNI